MKQFEFELQSGLSEDDVACWRTLEGHPDSAELIKLMSDSGMDGFQFYRLNVKREGRNVVVFPLFLTRYSLASTLDGPVRNVLGKVEGIFSGILKPIVLGVGFVEGEWAQLAIDHSFDDDTIFDAVSAGLEEIERVAGRLRASIVALKDFTSSTVNQLPQHALRGFAQAVSLPFCQMRIPFADEEEYLNSIPRKVRQDLRRKIRQSANVEIVETADVSKYIDAIYEMYVRQTTSSDLSFGAHRKEYFATICNRVPGAKFFLFFADGEMIGFNLVIDRQIMLVDKYIGMREEAGRENNMYFMAWLQKIRYCIEHKIPVLHLGAAAEGVKVRLGASIIPSYVFFHHRNPVVNKVLKRLTNVLSYEPAVDGPLMDTPPVHNTIACGPGRSSAP